MKENTESEFIKRRSRHAITHSVVAERYKKFQVSTIILFLSWILFILAILNSAFLFVYKESVFGSFFEYVFKNIWLRVLFFGLFIYVALDFARSIGISSIVQPFQRFIRHMGTVTISGGEKFIIRKKDEYFLPVAVAFNQMINRLKNSYLKEIEDTRFLLQLIEKEKISLTPEDKMRMDKIKEKINTPISDIIPIDT